MDGVAGYSLPTEEAVERLAVRIKRRPVSWETRYLQKTFVADIVCGLAAGLFAFIIRFGGSVNVRLEIYLGISLFLPVIWAVCVGIAGATIRGSLGWVRRIPPGPERGSLPDRRGSGTLLRGQSRPCPRLCCDRTSFADRT